jgi:hypothetical protein
MIDDLFYIIAGGFTLAVAILIVIIASIYMGQVSDNVGMTSEYNQTMHNTFARFPVVFDNMVAFIIVGLMGASLALLYYVSVSPALFFVIILMCSLAVIVTGFMSNAWTSIITSGAISAVAGSVPKMNFIMTHYVAFVMLYIVLSMIVFFAKPDAQGGGL